MEPDERGSLQDQQDKVEAEPPERVLPAVLFRHRGLATFGANLAIIASAYAFAFWVRFDFAIPSLDRRTFLQTFPVLIVIQYASFYAFKLTRGWWRYVGIGDFLNAVKAAAVGALGLAMYVIFFYRHFPRSIFIIYPILLIGLSIGTRLAVRLWRQIPTADEVGQRKRLLIIGAGDTGETLLREIRRSGRLNYRVIAFLDDDEKKRRAYIDSVPVVDGIDATPDVVSRFRIDEIIVATPSASGTEMRRITERCAATGVPFRVMPATWEVLSGQAGIGAARKVEINDLLRRPPIELDLLGIGRFLKGKCVLVTGAAGSIGSEICRQVLRYQPARLLCVDHDENALFYLERSLAAITGHPVGIRYHLADITDVAHIDALFAETKPHIVYHAAAHKHVPVIEANPVEGVRNNVFGTEAVATIAGRHDTEAFVLISTDKAVNPTSVMGATKRIAELLIQTLPWNTRYTAVRFGNVLGSRGSVVPLLKEQIAAGGPVTITHPEMRRYFMTIPEAVQLVIQSSAMGQGDQVFMLDMGEPVKIVDLARDLIRLSGLTPEKDIPIVFSGIRPGEKLFEELYLEREQADRTTHPKILIARHSDFEAERFTAQIDELRRAVAQQNAEAVRALLCGIVPEYGQPATGGNVIKFHQVGHRSLQ